MPQRDDRVLIKISRKEGVFWEKEYNKTDIIQNVINDYKEMYNEEIPEEYMIDWKHKNQSLKMTDQIKTLLANEIPTILIEHKDKIKPLKLGDEIIPEIVGKPFNNPFEVFVFNKKDKILKIQKYGYELIKNEGLDNYGPSSAYCNGNNYLFISGGETKNSEIIKKFWKIKLDTQEIETFDMKEKKNHSMIYIKGDYVFIVGGNDLKTFYFDIKESSMNVWGDLNISRTEPSLILISNHLYCFDNVNSKGKKDEFTIERTDITLEHGDWEIIQPILDSLENQKLNQKFFGVSKSIDDNILFLGGNMNEEDKKNKFNYKFNVNNKTVEVSEIPFEEYNFKEKTFLPYKNNVDYILPDFNRHHPEVIFFQKNKNKLSLVKYEPSKDKNLRSGKKNIIDCKYNFNMPSISLPTTENIISHKENINLNNNIKGENLIGQYKNNNENSNINDNEKNLFIKPDEDTIKNKDNAEQNDEDNNRIKVDVNINNESQKNLNLADNIDVGGEIKGNISGINKLINGNDAYVDIDLNNNLNIEGEMKLDPKIKLINPNLENTNGFPNMNINKPQNDINVNIPGLNNNVPQGEINANLPGMNINGLKSDINVNMPGIDINGPQSDVNAKLPDMNINLPEGEINTELPNMKMNRQGEINVNLPGMNIIKPEGDINANRPNMNMNQKIGEVNLNMPEIDLINPKGEIKASDINIKNPEIHLPSIQTSELDDINKKITINQPDLNVKVPEIKINTSNNADFHISGIIPGTSEKQKMMNNSNINLNTNLNGEIKGKMLNIDAQGPKVDINGPSLNDNIKGKNRDINMPGINVNAKGQIPSGNINLNGENANIKGKMPNLKIEGGSDVKPTFIMEGIIPGKKDYKKGEYKINSPDIKIDGNIPNVKVNSPDTEINLDKKIELTGDINGKNKIDINHPNAKFDLNIKNSDNQMSGIIPGIKSSDINIKGPSINMESKSPNLDIKPHEINLKSGKGEIKGNNPYGIKKPEFEVNGPDMGIKIPEANIKEKNIESKIDVKEPEIDINKKIPGIKFENPKIELPSGGIKLNGNLEGLPSSKINLGSPDLNIKGPKIDGKINANPQNLNAMNLNDPNFFLTGIIPGTNSINKGVTTNSPGINLEGPKLDVKGKMTDVDINGPKIDKKNLNVNGQINLKGDNDLTGVILGIKDKQLLKQNIDIKGPELNNNLNGQLNVPNAEINIKGSNVNVPNINLSNQKLNSHLGGIDIKGKNPSVGGDIPGVKVLSQNIEIKGPTVNLKDSKENSKNEFHLEGIIPARIDKNNKLILEGTLPGVISSGKGQNLIIEDPISSKKKLNFHGSLNDQNYPFENEIKGSRRLDFDGMNNINVEIPKARLKANNQINFGDTNKLEFEGGNIGGGINLTKNVPTQLKVKTDNNINEDNKFGINLKLDQEIKNDDLDLNNLGKNFISESNPETKISLGNSVVKKKGKGLPIVGNKNFNFEPSKVDTAGKFEEANIDVHNLKSANVGINGQKIGERIEE